MGDDTTTTSVDREVKALRDFYTHLVMYVLFNGVLLTVNWRTGPPWWALFPAIGWGLGVVGHAAALFVVPRLLGADWEARTRDRLSHRH